MSAALETVPGLDLYADVVLGDREGVVYLAFGRKPHRDSRGKYEHLDWQDNVRYAWPAERDRLAADVAREVSIGEAVDIYVCPAARQRNAHHRRKGDAIPPAVLWTDLDAPPADAELYARLVAAGSLVVRSGSDEHRHLYLPLSRPVDLGTFNRLNQALAAQLGGDSKWADNSLLRMPGTLNWKSAIRDGTVIDGEPVPVEILGHTPGAHDPDELAALLGVDLSSPQASATASERARVVAEPAPDPLPSPVRRALDNPDVADRSKACGRVVEACSFSRLTEGQALSVLRTYPPAERYKNEQHMADDVARLYEKFPPPPAPTSSADSFFQGAGNGPQINGEPLSDPTEGATGHDMSAGKLPLQSFAELAAEVDAMGEPRWLIEGIWPDGDYGVLAAESKAQKTWSAIDLAVSVAAGLPWLGSIPTRRQGPVILFIGEGGKRNTVRRIRATAEHHGVDPNSLDIYVCARAPHLGDQHHLAEFAAMVEGIRPALVIVDPLYLAAAGGNLADLYAMGELLERPQRICQQYGANLQLVHHFNRKAGAVGRERMSGAGPAEWGRVLISGVVESRHTDPATKATTVVTLLDVVGGEIAEQSWRVERRIWSDDPTDLGAPLHLTVSATDVTDADTTAATPAGPKLSPAETKLLEALDPDEARSVTEIVDRIAAIHGHGLKRPTVSTGLNRLRELGLADCDEPESRFAPKLWRARNVPSPVSASPVSAPVSAADTRGDTDDASKTAGRPGVSSVSDTEPLTRRVSSVSAAYIGADTADTGRRTPTEEARPACGRCRQAADRLIAGLCPSCAYPAGDAPDNDQEN